MKHTWEECGEDPSFGSVAGTRAVALRPRSAGWGAEDGADINVSDVYCIHV